MSDQSQKRPPQPSHVNQSRQAPRGSNIRPDSNTRRLGGGNHHPPTSSTRPIPQPALVGAAPQVSDQVSGHQNDVGESPTASPSSDLSSIPDSPVAPLPTTSPAVNFTQPEDRVVEAVRTRPSKRQAEAATLGPHRAPKAKIPRTHAANPVRTRVDADQAVVTNESLDAWRQCLLTMREQVAKQPFLTSHTRATTSNNDALIAFSGPQAPAALLHTNTPLAPTLSGSSDSAGINRGRVKQEPSSVSRPDVHAAPSSRGLQELVCHARASPASNPASDSVQIVKGPTCKKANRPLPV